jgi:hypothetical protein
MKILQGNNINELEETINFKPTEYSINGESILLSNKDGVVCVILDVGEIEAFKKISFEVGHDKRKSCLAGAKGTQHAKLGDLLQPTMDPHVKRNAQLQTTSIDSQQ